MKYRRQRKYPLINRSHGSICFVDETYDGFSRIIPFLESSLLRTETNYVYTRGLALSCLCLKSTNIQVIIA